MSPIAELAHRRRLDFGMPLRAATWRTAAVIERNWAPDDSDYHPKGSPLGGCSRPSRISTAENSCQSVASASRAWSKSLPVTPHEQTYEQTSPLGAIQERKRRCAVFDHFIGPAGLIFFFFHSRHV